LENTVKVTVLSADLVLADRVGIYKVNFKDDRIRRSKQALSYVFKKGATGWKIIHVHESLKDI
jgi:ketosteroid isomerase-like protein